jgi:drug/metabolite transporter superfamily protein YnfA
MLVYLAAAGAAVVLMWVRDRDEAPRLFAYGVTLAGGCALDYLLFASNDNRLPVCDALSPVWLSTLTGAGAVAVLLSMFKVDGWPARLGAAALGGVLIAGFYALAWPHCTSRLEGVSPELDYLWLSRVREALPIYKHDRGVLAAVLSLPVSGLIGYGLALWRTRRDPAQLVPWATLAALSLLATGLLLWQTRAGPAAQLLAIPGATALAWIAIARAQQEQAMLVRVAATVVAFFVISGLAVQNVVNLLPKDEEKKNNKVDQANNRCPTLAGLKPIALQKPGYVFTHVDLGPRLITVTNHKAVAGPYHRNQQDIIDVMKGFRGTPEYARGIIQRRGIDYVLICPGMSETTIYSAEAPKGFYAQINAGKVPAWLQPVALPKDSPYKMWRVIKR